MSILKAPYSYNWDGRWALGRRPVAGSCIIAFFLEFFFLQTNKVKKWHQGGSLSQLVLVRHGQSQWNLENRFTGWVDVPLTEKGREEARSAGQFLKNANIPFRCAHTSYLQRAIETLWIILAETQQHWLPVYKHWRLNERHYGGLQGLNKQETREQHGEEQVFQWRRSYDVPPPSGHGPLQEEQLRDPRYADLSKDEFPSGESLKNTLERVEPYWQQEIRPQLERGENILIAAHGNSLRALVKILTQMSENEITQFEFATGVPLKVELDGKLAVQSMDWLKSEHRP